MIEFTIQSQIFTRKFAPEKRRKSFFGSKPKKEIELPDPEVQYSISIGDVQMCTWSGQEDNWEAKSNDPEEFPYHKDTIAVVQQSQQPTIKK